MYEAAHVRPSGAQTVARAARTLADAEFEGLVVRTAEASWPAGVADRYDVDVVDGATVEPADPAAARAAVDRHRDDHTLLLLEGGTGPLDRFAVEEPRVDVLVGPAAAGGRDPPFDDVDARLAADNGVRLEFDLGAILRSTGGERVRAIRGLRRLHTLVEKYDAPHVVSATPATHLQVRAVRELVALGETVGLPTDFVREGLREWGRLADRNRERVAADWILPGLRRGRPEEADAPAERADRDDEGDER